MSPGFLQIPPGSVQSSIQPWHILNGTPFQPIQSALVPQSIPEYLCSANNVVRSSLRAKAEDCYAEG
jgi:hypothetical protein